MKTLISILRISTILPITGLILGGASALAEPNAREIKAEFAKEALYGPVAIAGYKWAGQKEMRDDGFTGETSPHASSQTGYRSSATQLATVLEDRKAAHESRVAKESTYKWGILSSAHQNTYKWGILSASTQSTYKWGILSSAAQNTYKWGILSSAAQNTYKWGILSSAAQNTYKWGILSSAGQSTYKWGIL